MLVIAELFEAVEAHRKDKRANLEKYAFETNKLGHPWWQMFHTYIKYTIEDELADTVIRLLDLAGLRGMEIDRECFADNDFRMMNLPELCKTKTLAENIFHITMNMASKRLSEIIEITIKHIECLCKSLSIDLWQHVELKMKYNQTREYKHNKLY